MTGIKSPTYGCYCDPRLRSPLPVSDGLAHPKRRRWHLHFTSTSAWWLNLIENWFSVLTRKTLTNASFTSTGHLEEAIDVWASHWNDNPQPFVWTKTVEDIINKVKGGRATLDRVTESATTTIST